MRNLSDWIAELRRRRVFRMAAWYGAGAWLLIQIAVNTFGPLGLPSWSVRATIILCLAGFPVALVLSWFFDLNPDREPAPSAEALGLPRSSVGWSVWLGLAAGVLLGIGALQAWQAATGGAGPDAIPTAALEVLTQADRLAAEAARMRDLQQRRTRRQAALDRYTEAARLAPRFVKAWLGVVDMHVRLAYAPGEDFAARRDAAVRALATVKELDPGSRVSLQAEASLLRRLDEDPRALEPVQRALLALDPDDPANHTALANTLANLGRWDDRLRLTTSRVSVRPSDSDAWWDHAHTLVALRDYAGARRAYDQAIATRQLPETELYIDRALLEVVERGDLASFIAFLDQHNALFERHQRWLYQRWWWSLAQGDALKAVQTVETAVVNDWAPGTKDDMLGVAWMRAGERERGMRYLRAALAAATEASADPVSPGAWRWNTLQRAMLLSSMGENEASLEILRSLEGELDPADMRLGTTRLHAFMGSVYGMAGKTDAALRHLRIVLSRRDWQLTPWTIALHHYNARLRQEPAFQALLREHGVEIGAPSG